MAIVSAKAYYKDIKNTIKRKQKSSVKESNCKFCNIETEGENLERHLKNKETCRNLYFRLFRVRSNDIDAILVKLYSCISCYTTTKILLKRHLVKNMNCLEGYRRKFKVKDLESISKKVAALKKSSVPSRTKLSRAFETQNLKKKRDDEKRNQSVTMSLNDYRSSVQLANYKCCAVCQANFNETGAKEVKPSDEMFKAANLDSPTKKVLRRMEKFWLCDSCTVSPNEVPKDEIVTSEAQGPLLFPCGRECWP